MPSFSRSFVSLFCVTAVILLAFGAMANGAMANEDVSQFAIVAPDNPLQGELQIVRRAAWNTPDSSAAQPSSTQAGSTPVALTRYEIALETAKALIAVRARHHADANWHHGIAPQSLRALRALCVAFKTELTGFETNVPATLKLLDELLAEAGTARENALPVPASGSTPAQRVPDVISESLPDETLMQSLSQRLRVYSALDSLARQQNDPLAVSDVNTRSGGVRRLRAGATFEVSPELQLRAEFQNQASGRPLVPGLRDFLNADTFHLQNAGFGGARSIGAGIDWNLLPGVTVSGGVSRVDEFSRGGNALRYEGGVGFSGWQNRVALSAHLSRLVPEDSLALGTTAARLNLGVGLTSQVQLKLMYQQMFGAGAALQTNPRFGGGLDFSF
jgi:hypothetical protein